MAKTKIRSLVEYLRQSYPDIEIKTTEISMEDLDKKEIPEGRNDMRFFNVSKDQVEETYPLVDDSKGLFERLVDIPSDNFPDFAVALCNLEVSGISAASHPQYIEILQIGD